MSRQTVAGFLMGVSAGVAIGYFLKPPDQIAVSKESDVSHDRQAVKHPDKVVSGPGSVENASTAGFSR